MVRGLPGVGKSQIHDKVCINIVIHGLCAPIEKMTTEGEAYQEAGTPGFQRDHCFFRDSLPSQCLEHLLMRAKLSQEIRGRNPMGRSSTDAMCDRKGRDQEKQEKGRRCIEDSLG